MSSFIGVSSSNLPFEAPHGWAYERNYEIPEAESLDVEIDGPPIGKVHRTIGENLVAWFLVTDSDGKTFYICPAFLPGDPDTWEKVNRALKAQTAPAGPWSECAT